MDTGIFTQTQDSNEQDLRRRIPHEILSQPSDDSNKQSIDTENNSDSFKSESNGDNAEDLIDSVLEVPTKCVEQAREVGKRVVRYVVDHSHLPHWLVDNEFLISNHRPPMPSFKQCFASIFHLHTETINIWTHLLGTLFFIIVAIYFNSRPSSEVQIEKKLICGAFCLSAIVCFLCSTLYHTLRCHSPTILKLFTRLDYCGIAILIIGSSIPLTYYQFYCEFGTKVVYLTLTGLLGIACIVISMWDKFSVAEYRIYRALLFIAFSICGAIPLCHYTIRFGVKHAFTVGATHYWLIVAFLYVTGASLYAARIPERLAPGLFDIWFQSHQLFHVFVVIAACVHYYGICVLSHNQSHFLGDCQNVVNSNTAGISSIIK